MVKINTDAAIFEEEKSIRIGVIIRDERRAVITAKALKIGGETEVLRTEVLVAKEGATSCNGIGAEVDNLGRGLTNSV